MDSILCETHGKSPSPACDTCKSVMVILGPDRCRSYGIVPLESIPEASSSLETFRNQGSKRATLTLSQAELDYGHSVYFSKPLPKPKYDEIIRDHLFLSTEQNHHLMANLELEEPLASKLRGHLKDWKNQVTKHIKDGRIHHRPVILSVCYVEEATKEVKVIGQTVGLQYPQGPPSRTILGPFGIIDYLAYNEEESEVLPLLEEVDIFFGG